MSQLFHPAANAIAKGTIFGAIFIIAIAAWVAAVVDRSPWMTQENVSREQPVPFSHEHHVNGLGIDCRYCHTGVTESAFAGIPPTKTCMTCHSQIWTNATMLEPVRASWRNEKPIEWTRVHKLPDFVFFNHSIHVAKGIGCVSCHGQVDKMPLMYQANSLRMGWCLDCHRAPENHIRPKSEVFNMNWDPSSIGETQASLGPKLVEQYHVRKGQLTDCYVCHR